MDERTGDTACVKGRHDGSEMRDKIGDRERDWSLRGLYSLRRGLVLRRDSWRWERVPWPYSEKEGEGQTRS